MQIPTLEKRAVHNKLRDRIAEEYRAKGYFVATEKWIGHRRVDIYAENTQEVLIIEVVDTHYAGCLDEKDIYQLKVGIKAAYQHTGTFYAGIVKVQRRAGNTHMLTVPTAVVRALGLKDGDELTVYVDFEKGEISYKLAK